MSGFTDSIVGGVGSLIRQYIKSPNYAKGVSGWSINQDGSAEFNDATFRGTVVIDAAGTSLLIYDGAPAAGNLILSLSAFAGTDVYGNNYPGGICTTNANGTASNAGYTSRWNPTDPLSGVQPLSLAFINNLQCGLISQLELFVQSTTNDLVLQAGPGNFLRALADNIFIGQAGATLSKIQFGAGAPGGYYHEDGNLSGGINTGGTTFNLESIDGLSDYGSAIVGNTWTAPVNAVYLINASIDVHGTFSSGIRTAFAINTSSGLVVQDDTLIPAANQWTKQVTLCKYLLAGTTVTITSFMPSGTSLSIFNSSFAFHRML